MERRHSQTKRTVLLLTALLSGCSISDFKQLTAPSGSSLLISQDQQHSPVLLVAEQDIATSNDAPVISAPLPVTPSVSLAVNLDDRPADRQVDTLEQVQKTLIHYLAIIEQHPEQTEQWLSKAEQLAERYPEDALIQSILQRISRYSEWQPVGTIINSAGIDFIGVNGWRPESPFLRTRRALLPPVAENEQVIFGDQRLVLLLTNLNPVSLHIDARLDDLPFLPEMPAQLLYQVDERPPEQVLLNAQDDWRRLKLNIPAGEHAVRIYQPQPVGNQFIKLRFDDTVSDFTVMQERPYFISTEQTPLELYSLGPSQLRIDELDQDQTSYRYQTVPEGWQTIRLPPSQGKSRSLFRVSQRVSLLTPKPINNRIVQRPIIPVADPEIADNTPAPSKTVDLIDAYSLGKQQNGTLSAGLDLVRRNNFQESGIILGEEQFSQYKLNYRYLDEPRAAYWNTESFLRIREHGGNSFGLQESIYYQPDWLPFSLRTSAKIIAQVPHDNLEALGQLNLSIANAYNLHPKTRLIPSLSFFARAMTLRTNNLARTDPKFKVKVDQDVFTPYKGDHTAGFSPSLTLEHRPWLDTVWSGKIGMGTNEDFDISRPDHYNTEAHWRQLLGSVVLDGFYRISFYQPDADRSHATRRSYTGVELNWQHWARNQNRIELGARYSYDIERRAHLATLSVTLHFGEGRGLRDFAPGETDFRDFRQRQFNSGLNNVMNDDAYCAGLCPGP